MSNDLPEDGADGKVFYWWFSALRFRSFFLFCQVSFFLVLLLRSPPFSALDEYISFCCFVRLRRLLKSSREQRSPFHPPTAISLAVFLSFFTHQRRSPPLTSAAQLLGNSFAAFFFFFSDHSVSPVTSDRFPAEFDSPAGRSRARHAADVSLIFPRLPTTKTLGA